MSSGSWTSIRWTCCSAKPRRWLNRQSETESGGGDLGFSKVSSFGRLRMLIWLFGPTTPKMPV